MPQQHLDELVEQTQAEINVLQLDYQALEQDATADPDDRDVYLALLQDQIDRNEQYIDTLLHNAGQI